MSTTCDIVAERIALGEPLGDAADHATTCSRCRRLAALPTELGAVRREADPGLGFTARMTAGAQHRIAVRKRRRLAGGLAVAIAVTSLGVFAVTREAPHEQQVAVAPPPPQPAVQTNPDPWASDEADEDVRELLHLANHPERGFTADWGRIQKPLAPYRVVLQGVDNE